MTVENPFTKEVEAKCYHDYRPKYHHLPFKEINKLIGHNFDKSLDVACGTGHSTEALSKYSTSVVGVDLSTAMLKEAKSNYNLEFINSKAEELPFEDTHFDFINISMAFHWLDQELFLQEASRVLKRGGHLSIDSYGFLRNISKDATEEELHDSIFKKHLKPVSRNASYPTVEMWEKYNFSLMSDFKYKQTLSMSADEFSNLLMTWSNYQVLSSEKKEAAQSKIYETYSQIFKNKNRDLSFGGRTLLLIKN